MNRIHLAEFVSLFNLSFMSCVIHVKSMCVYVHHCYFCGCGLGGSRRGRGY